MAAIMSEAPWKHQWARMKKAPRKIWFISLKKQGIGSLAWKLLDKNCSTPAKYQREKLKPHLHPHHQRLSRQPKLLPLLSWNKEPLCPCWFEGQVWSFLPLQPPYFLHFSPPSSVETTGSTYNFNPTQSPVSLPSPTEEVPEQAQ